MVSTTVDHLISISVYLITVVLVISLFASVVERGTLYLEDKRLHETAARLMSHMLLLPGYPPCWGHTDETPILFGLQDPKFTQIHVSSFSLMRLQEGTAVYYSKTGRYYYDKSEGDRQLFLSSNIAVSYATARDELSLTGEYEFQIEVYPALSVEISVVQDAPLTLKVFVHGTCAMPSIPVNYSFIKVVSGAYLPPSTTVSYGNGITDLKGEASFVFPEADMDDAWAFVAVAHEEGIISVGVKTNSPAENFAVPLIESITNRTITLAHSKDLYGGPPPYQKIYYNATFYLLTEDFTLQLMSMEYSTGKVGTLVYGEGRPYGVVTIPTISPGILVIATQTGVELGVSIMEWGVGSLGSSLVFGPTPPAGWPTQTTFDYGAVDRYGYKIKLIVWRSELE
jgi:hypothetical protein